MTPRLAPSGFAEWMESQVEAVLDGIERLQGSWHAAYANVDADIVRDQRRQALLALVRATAGGDEEAVLRLTRYAVEQRIGAGVDGRAVFAGSEQTFDLFRDRLRAHRGDEAPTWAAALERAAVVSTRAIGIAVADVHARQSAELKSRLDRVRKLEQAQRDFSAFLVHDLNNLLAGPMAALSGLSVLPPHELDAVERDCAESLRRLSGLAADLLDVAQIEDGSLAPRPAAVSVSGLADQVASALRTRAAQYAVNIVTDVEPVVVRADARLMRRTLENLADNAMRYTPRGGTVTIRAARAAGYVRITVADTGPAVPEAVRADIFEKYWRSQDHAARSSRGLGLYFCKLVVEDSGGRVWTGAAADGTCEFHIELPAVVPEGDG